MRILLVNHEFTITGASLSLVRLADHLRAVGHDLVVYAANPAPGPMKDAYLTRGIPVLDPVDSADFDVAICNSVCVAEVLNAAATDTRTIWLIRETDLGFQLLMEHASVRRAFAVATAVVFQTEIQRDVIYRSFIYKLDPKKFYVIPQGIEVPGVVPAPTAPGRLRIVAVGTVDRRKRQGDLVAAVARIASPAIDCLLIGQFFDLDPAAQALVDANPQQFQILGQLPHAETLQWLASADIFCLPSSSESQPVSALEAGALGRAMILSDLPIHEGIWRHGRNCLMFPVGDVDLLAQQIALLGNSPGLRQRLGAAAQAVAASFRPAALYARLDALLAAIV